MMENKEITSGMVNLPIRYVCPFCGNPATIMEIRLIHGIVERLKVECGKCRTTVDIPSDGCITDDGDILGTERNPLRVWSREFYEKETKNE